jgi:hypothetical protein
MYILADMFIHALLVRPIGFRDIEFVDKLNIGLKNIAAKIGRLKSRQMAEDSGIGARHGSWFCSYGQIPSYHTMKSLFCLMRRYIELAL